MLKTNLVKKDFPIFKNNPDLVYLDSTATTLKPKSVLDRMLSYYSSYCANVFRGVYSLSEKATEEYEKVRTKVARFININDPSEVIFVRNTTEAINLVAYSWGRLNISKGDEIVTTIMEHHSNFVPWQQLCFKNAGVFKVIDISDDGNIEIEDLKKSISKKTKLLAITHVSNVLGTINPIKKMVKEVKKINPSCLVLVDGAQAVSHMKVDVSDLGCDFYTFSGHKMLGPTGVGVLWGKKKLLDKMLPFNFGGEMISKVDSVYSTFKEIPHKFEAGTPHIAGVIGLGTAVDFLSSIGMDRIRRFEEKITAYALKALGEIRNLVIYGPKDASQKGGIVAFSLRGAHPHDIAQILDDANICIRAGHHCAMPLHKRLGVTGTARASFYIYNSKKDIDKLVSAIYTVKKVLRLK